MKLFEKIAEFFRKNESYSLYDFQIEDYEIRFKELNDQILLDIGNYIKKKISRNLKVLKVQKINYLKGMQNYVIL